MDAVGRGFASLIPVGRGLFLQNRKEIDRRKSDAPTPPVDCLLVWLLHALALCQEILLACDRGRADLRELRLGPHTCEEWIRVYRRIGAIVSLYCSLQQLESRVGLAAVREVRCKVIIYFRIVLRLHSAGQRDNFRQGPVRRAGLQHIDASPLGHMRRAHFHRFSFLALVHEGFDQLGPEPLGARITKMDIIQGPFVVSAELKHTAAGPPAGVVGITTSWVTRTTPPRVRHSSRSALARRHRSSRSPRPRRPRPRLAEPLIT